MEMSIDMKIPIYRTSRGFDNIYRYGFLSKRLIIFYFDISKLTTTN